MSAVNSAVRSIDTPDVSFSLKPLQPTIGAEIGGIDLKQPLSPADRDGLRAAILAYKVLFFRDQHLDRRQQEDFARAFGPLYTHPHSQRPAAESHPAIHAITPEGFRSIEQTRIREGDKLRDTYHTDTSWRLVPAWGAVLRAVRLPEAGGDTVWVDANLAFEGLTDDIKARLEGLYVTHDYLEKLRAAGHDYPLVAHPLVRTHRETGQKILWVNYTQKPTLIGLDRAESAELLTIILDQYRRPEYQVRFSWTAGAVAFWDNRATVHYAVRNYGDFPRLMERVLIADEPLYADL